jgi:hypothetical protein
MDYKQELLRRVEELELSTKRGEVFEYERQKYDLTIRDERMRVIDIISTKYAISHAEFNDNMKRVASERGEDIPLAIPYDVFLLERLSELVLHEENTDMDRMKSKLGDYPFLTKTQLARRKEGKHKRKEDFSFIEVPLAVAGNVGTDGRDYNYPIKRKRSERECTFVNEKARSNNRLVRKKYEAFIRGENCVTINGDIVDLKFIKKSIKI